MFGTEIEISDRMSKALFPRFAYILLSGGGPITRFEVILFLLAAGAVILVAICWGIVEDWIEALVAATGQQSLLSLTL